MKTVFIDIETIPDSKKCDLALSRITKEYEREGKSSRRRMSIAIWGQSLSGVVL